MFVCSVCDLLCVVVWFGCCVVVCVCVRVVFCFACVLCVMYCLLLSGLLCSVVLVVLVRGRFPYVSVCFVCDVLFDVVWLAAVFPLCVLVCVCFISCVCACCVRCVL